MLEIRENVDIREYCTLKVGGHFRYFISVSSVDELKEALGFAKEKNIPIRIIGSGSNTVFPDGILENVVIKLDISGFEIIDETDKYSDIKVGTGENWDSVVSRSVDMNLSGIEALSAIPGTTGATPVQNVGAYGQEVKDTILYVEVYDLQDGTVKNLSNEECKFSYRDSAFKNEERNRYIIISVVFRLSKDKHKVPDYPGVKKYFEENVIANPTLHQVRDAIIKIRKNKLPNPKEIPNVGSFFKNPIVSNSKADELKTIYSNMTLFVVDENHTKIPAGWLIENAGLKGHDFGSLSTYVHNALVLVNNGKATRRDVENVKNKIINTVFDKFGITIEPEPEFV